MQRDDGAPGGGGSAPLDAATALRVLRTMWRIRIFEERVGMLKRAILAGLMAVTASVGVLKAADTAPYPAAFDAVWNTVNDNFYDPNFHGVDWKAVGERYRAKLGSVIRKVQP